MVEYLVGMDLDGRTKKALSKYEMNSVPIIMERYMSFVSLGWTVHHNRMSSGTIFSSSIFSHSSKRAPSSFLIASSTFKQSRCAKWAFP